MPYLLTITFLLFGFAITSSGVRASKRQISCPDGFLHHGGSCYKIHRELFNWPEAYSFCKALNSHLARIDSAEEFTFLTNRIQETRASFQGSNGYYVGATDSMVQGEFRWADSTDLVTYLPWSPGQPDKGVGEDCLGIHPDLNGKYLYHDYMCTDRVNFICEREVELGPVLG